MTRLKILCAAFVLAGCTQMNDIMTPGIVIDRDNYDDTSIVVQPPVAAALFSDDAWMMLGFEWQERNPDVVFLKVGLNGVVNITDLEVKADGIEMTGIERTNTFTDFKRSGYESKSWSRFRLPIGEFIKMASGADVRMRIGLLDKYTVSRFGSGHSMPPVVNSKFAPFLNKVAELRGGLD